MIRWIAVVGLLAVLAVAFAGCGGRGTASDSGASSPTPTPSASGSPASSAVIIIKGFAFSGPDNVKPGETVTVKNLDQEAHTVTADKGKVFDVKIAPGKTATFTTPSSAGKYAYHCEYHSNMHGMLTVSG